LIAESSNSMKQLVRKRLSSIINFGATRLVPSKTNAGKHSTTVTQTCSCNIAKQGKTDGWQLLYSAGGKEKNVHKRTQSAKVHSSNAKKAIPTSATHASCKSNGIPNHGRYVCILCDAVRALQCPSDIPEENGYIFQNMRHFSGAYIDDIIVYTETVTKHVHAIRQWKTTSA